MKLTAVIMAGTLLATQPHGKTKTIPFPDSG